MTKTRNTPDSEQQLESWKEISAYLKRDVRTLARWEKEEGLPVRRHKHSKASTVYAYPGELDAWRAARNPAAGEEFPRTPRRRLIPVAAGGLALLAVAALVLWGPIMNPPDPLADAAEAAGIVVRQVWAEKNTDTSGTPSPDGRYISGVDWDTGDIAVRNLESGEIRRLTKKGTWVENPVEYGLLSAFSPDGRQVAFTWLNWRADNPNGPGELRLASLDADPPDPRILYRSEEVEYVYADGWSPDGRQVLVLVNRKDRTNQIGLVSVADGSLKVLKSMSWRSPVEMAFSADGRYILYDFPVTDGEPERDIFLLAADGSREIPLITHPANDYVLDWTPDGDGILFASDRSGTWDIWHSRVEKTKTVGRPKLLKRNVGRILPMGFTSEGAFYYGVAGSNSDVYTAEFNPETGQVEGEPERVGRRFIGRNSGPTWSPDGRRLAFVSQRGPLLGFERGLITGWTLVIRDLETGRDREIPVRITNQQRLRPRWSPGGNALLAPGSDSRGREGVYSIDAETGKITTIKRFGSDEWSPWADWSPDGKSIFYLVTHRVTRARRIMRLDLASGEEKRIHKDTDDANFFQDGAVSPDGRLVAFRASEGLVVMSTAGGPLRQLHRDADQGRFNAGIAWTPDSRHVLFSADEGEFPRRALWRVAAAGGEPHEVGLVKDWLGVWGVSMYPDGRRIAFHATDQPSRYTNEVWVMENFLPETRAAK